MEETLVLTFRQVYMSSLKYNLNYKNSVYTLQYILVGLGLNKIYLSCLIITSLLYVLCNCNTRHSFYMQLIYSK